MANIASVVINNCTREFDKEYHYNIPENMIDTVKPGVRVIVPFGRSDKSLEAYVLKLLDSTEMKGLKAIKRVIDDKPLLNKDMLILSTWMKKRYMCTYADVIRCMLPPGIGVSSTCIVRLTANKIDAKGSIKKIIDTLSDLDNECELSELRRRVNSKTFSKSIKAMEEMSLISICEEHSAHVKEKSIRAAFLTIPREEVIEEIESNRIKKIQQIRVLEMLIDNEYISVPDITRFAGVSPSVLDTLKKYGFIDFKDIAVNRDPLKGRTFAKTEPLRPTLQQIDVLRKVKEKLDKEEFSEMLIHGVTGSGKTEVYLQLIQHCIEMNKQAIVLVPEISLTPQMVERFKGRFGEYVAVLHSRLSLGERFDQWKLIKDGKVKIAVGARSAVFAPFESLGIIIIDEEHENSYKSETTPKYQAREVAIERCKQSNAVLLYGSATPSVETFYAADNGAINLLEMKERANNMVMPHVDIIDMRVELDEGNRSIFSRKLASEIDNNIKAGQQTILFLNRRGYSSFVLCRNCGYTVKCRNCNISLTYHSYDERLICHYCGYTIKNPEVCPKCGSNHIRHFGTGTQKVEDDIKKQFPNSTSLRMDMDTTSYKNSHEEILSTFRDKNINIMIGTQMIAKGHDFPNVTLVGVLAADSLLNMDDYRATERTFQLITQVAGRAGRGEISGRVVVQTYNTEDFSILAACKHDYNSFYKQEIKLRETLNYPPFTNIAIIILNGINDRLVFNKAKDVKVSIEEGFLGYEKELNIFGPTRSPLSKIKNKYRWRIVIKCKDMEKLIMVMTKISDDYYNKKEKNSVDMSVDINPVSML